MNSTSMGAGATRGGPTLSLLSHRVEWYLLLALGLCAAPSHTRAAKEYHDHVVILLDASGSMKGAFHGASTTRMKAAKEALKAVLVKVPQSTHVGLLVFSAANLNNDWAYPLGPRDDTRLLAAIDPIEPGRDTPLGRYIKIAADRLLEERAKQFGYGTYRLLIVTDGEAQDQALVDRYTPDVISRGVTVDVIGVAMSQNHTLATKVHSYRRADDPAALNRALTEIFAEIPSSDRGAVESEAFASIAPLPDAVAASMIQAVASLPNHPIGEKPKVTMPPPAPPAPKATTPSPVSPSKVVQPQPPQADSTRSSRRQVAKWAVIAGIAVVALLLRKLGWKGARR